MTPIQHLLDDGVPVEDLVELVEGAAELVASGQQEARWWYPVNLFAGVTCDRWRQDIAQLQATREAADARTAELAAMEARGAQEAAQAAETPVAVRNLELHRLAREAMEAIRGRDVVASEDAQPVSEPAAAGPRPIPIGIAAGI